MQVLTGNDGDYTNVVDGTSAGEQLLGSNGRDLIHGLGGNDTIFGFGGDDKFDGGDGDDYLSGGNGSFSGSGNDILIGGAGVDTLVGEDGDDLLIGGAGNDKYIWQAGSDSDVIDNTGGGTDWLFFNGVDRTRLSFHRSGDDLLILVDGDATQQVRVQDHFLGGDLAISYVQPGDGYAIPAANFSSLLTPLPAGFVATAGTMSLRADAGLSSAQTLDEGTSAQAWGARSVPMEGAGRRPRRRGGYASMALAHEPSSGADAAFGHGGAVDRQTQQLIEAMSRFNPVSGEASTLQPDVAWEAIAMAAGQGSSHHFKEMQSAGLHIG